MPDPLYLTAALGCAVAITVALRAVPFAMKNALRESALVADLGRWMPLGAVAVLAVYCLSGIDLNAAAHGSPHSLGPLVGTVVTAVVHRWRRNAVLSILAGTAACLVIVNAL